MPKDVVEANIKGVMPTPNGSAVFLGTEEKTFVITVDQYIGNALSMAINKAHKERPLTHDLMNKAFEGLGVTLDRVLINNVSDSIFYARIFLRQENELGQKFIELDARPSDSMVLAITSGATIYVARTVLDEVEDMTELLQRIIKEQGGQESDEESD